jgi:hypothetical protein
MISFRLTADEYNEIRKLCLTHGIRSVSEMARTAIHLLLREPARVQGESVEARLSDLEGRLQILALELKQLQEGS